MKWKQYIRLHPEIYSPMATLSEGLVLFLILSFSFYKDHNKEYRCTAFKQTLSET